MIILNQLFVMKDAVPVKGTSASVLQVLISDTVVHWLKSLLLKHIHPTLEFLVFALSPPLPRKFPAKAPWRQLIMFQVHGFLLVMMRNQVNFLGLDFN